ncbi:hypothetical protein [Rhodocista pekingensis]|uniref:Uncharacterized protein n=1 Tax=Rhodocista pekingensis TaxID=201185 RepID=A0ABW2KWT9_9PROT
MSDRRMTKDEIVEEILRRLMEMTPEDRAFAFARMRVALAEFNAPTA